jgi:hypothetical protein
MEDGRWRLWFYGNSTGMRFPERLSTTEEKSLPPLNGGWSFPASCALAQFELECKGSSQFFFLNMLACLLADLVDLDSALSQPILVASSSCLYCSPRLK